MARPFMTRPSARPALGARRRRFVLERPVEDPDGFGGVLRRYVSGPVLWGAIEPVGEAERTRLRGGRGDPVATHRITLRARSGLAPAMRLCAGPRRFVIRSLAPAGPPGGDLVCRVEEVPEETP
ncbi:head-tail adaptor [Methylobacterium sp. BE186]|uniref:head-tail adaptor protein n=1 Tax=Methylobacterium sp. BE186 TaxID=2817715 RepID=UPI00285DA668|nr:head-tail adaptor protein [Methylobacterium sp. BE186]MDR7039420.1 head-tail adaptor [Methylobacterium sp. BE186]